MFAPNSRKNTLLGIVMLAVYIFKFEVVDVLLKNN